DWSPDVCSSDLAAQRQHARQRRGAGAVHPEDDERLALLPCDCRHRGVRRLRVRGGLQYYRFPPGPAPAMFFLFGSPRSGTTLLARMLNAHPRILVPHETDFIVPMAFACDRLVDPALGRRVVADLIVGVKGLAGSLGEFIDVAEVRRLVDAAAFAPGAILDTVYAHLAARQGKRLAGDKLPIDLNFIRLLHKSG